MEHQKVLILDFGGQYNQLIARRVREQNVYCDLLPYDMTVEKIREYDPIGIIFTGGPNSVYADNAPNVKKEIFDLGIPVLGICYGCQLIAYKLGGVVTHANTREYGKSEIEYKAGPLFDGVEKNNVCWMSHTDYVSKVPEGFSITATTKTCPAAGFADEKRKIYGIQFHTEVHHTRQGERILHNFLYSVCGAKGDWTMSNFVSEQVERLREKVGDKKVLCAMSGGVDSAVAATLVHKAVGDRLVCVFVDHGLLRKGEADEVVSVFRDGLKMNLVKADAGERFLNKLKGVSDPEKNARSSAKNLSKYSKARRRRSAPWISWCRERFIPTSSRAARAPLRSSRVTTTWAGCPPSWISKRSWNRSAIFSRTKCGKWVPNSDCPILSYSASPFQGRGLPCVLWAKSLPNG